MSTAVMEHGSPETCDLIDEQALDNIRALQRPGGPDLMGKIIGLYFESSHALVQRMRNALVQNDPTELREAAHSLKSGSANLGAVGLAQLCKDLEDRGREDNLDGAEQVLTDVERTHDAVCHALTHVLEAQAA